MIERFDLLGHAAVLEVRDAWSRAGRRARRIWRDPAKRDRVKAHLVFALIFAFVITSTDYLITGGPEWSPADEAYAMEMRQARTSSQAQAATTALAASDENFAEIESVDYSFTTEALLGAPDTVLASRAAANEKPGAVLAAADPSKT